MSGAHAWAVLALALAVFMSGCSTMGVAKTDSAKKKNENAYASADPYSLDEDWEDEDAPGYSDPLRKFNKSMFKLNDGLYKYGARPIAKFYKTITPGFLRKRLKNIFDNAHAPGRVINSVLQGKPKRSGMELVRFLYNTTAGVGGMWNPAGMHKPFEDIPPEDTDQTFASWGIGPGYYIYLPLLGPTTVRGVFGKIGDSVLYPLNYIEPTVAKISVSGLEQGNDLSYSLGQYESIVDMSLDPYAAIKDAYFQFRSKQEEE